MAALSFSTLPGTQNPIIITLPHHPSTCLLLSALDLCEYKSLDILEYLIVSQMQSSSIRTNFRSAAKGYKTASLNQVPNFHFKQRAKASYTGFRH